MAEQGLEGRQSGLNVQVLNHCSLVSLNHNLNDVIFSQLLAGAKSYSETIFYLLQLFQLPSEVGAAVAMRGEESRT